MVSYSSKYGILTVDQLYENVISTQLFGSFFLHPSIWGSHDERRYCPLYAYIGPIFLKQLASEIELSRACCVCSCSADKLK